MGIIFHFSLYLNNVLLFLMHNIYLNDKTFDYIIIIIIFQSFLNLFFLPVKNKFHVNAERITVQNQA